MTQTKTKYPSAIYAAAGVGDLVYEQLRKLQTKAIEFGNEQAPQWKRRVADFDAGKVRESVVTSTQVAAEKASEVYTILVARGTKAFADQAKTVAKTATKDETKTETKTETSAPKASTPKADAPVAKKAATPRKKAA